MFRMDFENLNDITHKNVPIIFLPFEPYHWFEISLTNNPALKHRPIYNMILQDALTLDTVHTNKFQITFYHVDVLPIKIAFMTLER